jgi:hypothetical protein
LVLFSDHHAIKKGRTDINKILPSETAWGPLRRRQGGGSRERGRKGGGEESQTQKHRDRYIGRTPCDDRGRDWSDVSTSQRTQLPGTRKRQGRLLPRASGEPGPTDI